MTTASWLTELTGKPKSIIGMVHLPALPGMPLYDAAGGCERSASGSGAILTRCKMAASTP